MSWIEGAAMGAPHRPNYRTPSASVDRMHGAILSACVHLTKDVPGIHERMDSCIHEYAYPLSMPSLAPTHTLQPHAFRQQRQRRASVQSLHGGLLSPGHHLAA